MRTNIDIDDKLMKQAMKAANVATKKATVDAALRRMVQLKKQEDIRKWRGRIQWEGNLAAMREGRFLGLEPRRKAPKREKNNFDRAVPKLTAAR